MRLPFFRSDKGFNYDKTLSGRLTAFLRLCWRIICFPFRASWRAMVASAELAANWWKDRRLVHLLRGLPTLLLAAVCVWFLIGMRSTADLAHAEKYLTAGLRAANTGNWETAKLFLERAIKLGVGDNQTAFTLARAAEATHDTPMMVAIMQDLAPDDHAVFAPAHLWKATSILTAGNLTREKLDQAHTHLRHVLTLQPDHPGAHAILGDYYFQHQQWTAAIRHLEQAPRDAPKYRLLLAKACLQAGQRVKAERYAREAAAAAEAACAAEPENLERRLRWADAVTLLEDYPKAVSILHEGLKTANAPEIHQALALVYVHWSDSMEGLSETDLHHRFTLLARAMEHNPHELAVFDRMMSILKVHGSRTAEQAKAFLHNNLANSQAVGVSHLMLGTAAWINDDPESASIHLQRAFELMPHAATVANNFAWYLVNKDPPEPERALQMIEPVIQKLPDNAYVRDTRGLIYLRMGRLEDAVRDLEFALNQLKTNPDTHRALAEAYAGLGLNELAEVHKKAAESLVGHQQP